MSEPQVDAGTRHLWHLSLALIEPTSRIVTWPRKGMTWEQALDQALSIRLGLEASEQCIGLVLCICDWKGGRQREIERSIATDFGER